MIDLMLQQQRRFPYAQPVAPSVATSGLPTAAEIQKASGLQTASGSQASPDASPQESTVGASDGVGGSGGVGASEGVGAVGDTSLGAATTRGLYEHLFLVYDSLSLF